jgi:cation diffusion facilitator family transporter
MLDHESIATLRSMSHTLTCDADGPHTHQTPDLTARTRSGLSAVGVSLAILGVTALAQAFVFVASGSVALLADLIHNLGDALTALPVGLAFLLKSARAEKLAGWAVIFAMATSAVVAAATVVEKLIHPQRPDHLLALALAGAIGVAGNGLAARVRTNAGRKLNSAALIADGDHARVDALVSAGVVATAALVGIGFSIADPIVGLLITAAIGHITYEAWRTVMGREHAGHSR